MCFSAAPTVENDLVPRLPGRVAGRFNAARKIDTCDHGEPPHDRHLAGDRQSILVVERGVFDTDGHVAVHQIRFVEISECGLGAAVRLFDDNRLERRHARLTGSDPGIHDARKAVVQEP